MNNLEELDRATLEAFARVPPLPSANPAYHQTYESAMRRIQRRLQQFDTEAGSSSQKNRNERTNEHWHKKPVGIVVLSVTAGLLLLLIKFLLGL